MNQNIPHYLKEEKLISEEQFLLIEASEQTNFFSIFWELRFLLYLGVTCVSAGFGILIYQNIDLIGHHVIIAFITILCIGTFTYCWKNKKPFSTSYIENPSIVYDYILLLSCLLFLTLEGYLQYQYKIFGEKYGLATILPSLIFLFIAYRFDHRGILAMGISGIALWLGISLTPEDVLESDQFKDLDLVLSAIVLGVSLGAFSWYSQKKDLKKHFEFTFLSYSSHLIFISSIAGLIAFEYKFLFLILIGIAGYYFIRYAKQCQSFYFLLIATFYCYVSVTYLFTRAVDDFNISIESVFLYFILSCGFIIFFFLNYKKFLNSSK